MSVFKEVYADSYESGAINASASETFGGAQAHLTKRDRYGSANSLILTSLAEEDFTVDLDGISSRRIGILYRRGSLIIKPEDGIFFDTVKLTNVSATNAAAAEVRVRIARADVIQNG